VILKEWMMVVEVAKVVVEEAKVAAVAEVVLVVNANANMKTKKMKMAITLIPPVRVVIWEPANTFRLILVHEKVKLVHRSHLPELYANVIDPDGSQFPLGRETQELEEDMKTAALTLPFFSKLFT
jgi:hypothetical protein